MSNESFDAIVDPEKSWPTFFPADMTGEDLCEHMEGHGHDHGKEKDEHVWLSLKNAKTLVAAISDALQELDPDNKDTYAANASAYIEKLPCWMARTNPPWTARRARLSCLATAFHSAIWWMTTA